MYKEIFFRDSIAVIERSRSAAVLRLIPAHAERLPLLADEINTTDGVDVVLVMPPKGMITLTVDKSVTNNELVDTICDAISHIFDTDTTVSYTTSQEIDYGYVRHS